MSIHKRKITIGLSAKSLKQAQKELLQYQAEMQRKCLTFVSRLADKGIKVVMANLGGYGQYVSAMHNSTVVDENVVLCTLEAFNLRPIISEYLTLTGLKRVEVSPIAMAEFGSGWKATNPLSATTGIGQGSFPGQTHAFDPQGWWYLTADGVWHHSTGQEPKMPMLKAKRRMEREITKTIKEVWG